MKKRYLLAIEVALDDATESQIMDTARDCYRKSGGAEEENDAGAPRYVPAHEFVSGLGDALTELAEANPRFRRLGIEVVGSSIIDLTSEAAQPATTEAGLDECETGMYCCRWPDGGFSVVMASSRREALLALDEWDHGFPARIFPMPHCMFDFRLQDNGEFELVQTGDETEMDIFQAAYPVLDQVYLTDLFLTPGGHETPEAKEIIRAAVETERQRLANPRPQGPDAETEAGRRAQRELGLTGPVADHYAREAALQMLDDTKLKKSKPN